LIGAAETESPAAHVRQTLVTIRNERFLQIADAGQHYEPNRDKTQFNFADK